MIEVTGEAQRQAWDESVMPPVELVRPGLWSIPVPIPRNPLRYLLAYALEVDGALIGRCFTCGDELALPLTTERYRNAAHSGVAAWPFWAPPDD